MLRLSKKVTLPIHPKSGVLQLEKAEITGCKTIFKQ